MTLYRIRHLVTVKKIMVIVVVAVLIVPLFLNDTLILAQENTGGSGLSISPTRTELSILPGDTDKVVVSIRNITSGPVIAKIFVNDFEPDNKTGEPKLIVDPSLKNSASISGFLGDVEDARLGPGESKDVVINVAIPEGAAPGGYYGAIRFQVLPDKAKESIPENSEVSLTANLLSLVLIEVPGDIIQKVAVKSVDAFLDDKKGTFFTKQPNFAGVEIENLGNGFIKPFGTVTVKKTGGGEVFSYEINDSNPRNNVLPDSTRVFKSRLENIEKRVINEEEIEIRTSAITSPGRYTITANLSYGNGGEVFTVSSSFWYIPAWLIFTLVGLVLVIIVILNYLYRKYVTKTLKRRRR